MIRHSVTWQMCLNRKTQNLRQYKCNLEDIKMTVLGPFSPHLSTPASNCACLHICIYLTLVQRLNFAARSVWRNLDSSASDWSQNSAEKSTSLLFLLPSSSVPPLFICHSLIIMHIHLYMKLLITACCVGTFMLKDLWPAVLYNLDTVSFWHHCKLTKSLKIDHTISEHRWCKSRQWTDGPSHKFGTRESRSAKVQAC